MMEVNIQRNFQNYKLFTLSIKPINKLSDPIGDDEKNAVGVTVTTDMTREDVLKKILEMVNQENKFITFIMIKISVNKNQLVFTYNLVYYNK